MTLPQSNLISKYPFFSRLPTGHLRLGLQTGLLFSSNIFDRALGLVSSILIARHLTPSDLGVIGAALVLSSIASRISELGVPVILQRESAKNPSVAPNMLATGLGLRTIMNVALVMFMVAYGAITAGHSVGFVIVVLAGLSSAVTGWTQLLAAVFAGQLKMQYVALSQIVYRLMYVGCVSVVIVLDWGAQQLMLSLVLAAALQLALTLLIFQKRIFQPRFTFDWPSIRSLLQESWPLSIAGIMVMTYDRIDTLIASWFLDSSKVGNYYVAYNVYTTAYMFSNAFNSVAFTLLSAKASQSQPMVRAAYSKALLFLLMTGGLLSLLLYLGAEWIINVLYTTKYDLAATCLQTLSMAVIFVFANTLGGTTLNALGRQKVTMWIVVLGMTVNVVLNVIMLPLFGVVAAAQVTVLTEACVFMLTFIYLVWLFRWSEKNSERSTGPISYG